MAEQALEKSKDAKEMKKFRGSIKGQITIDVNKLGVLIGKKDGDDFDHTKINEADVKHHETKLKGNFDLFLRLHQKYCELREPEEDEAKESEFLQSNAEYSDEVTDKVFALYDRIKTYQNSYAKWAAKEASIQNIPMYEEKYKESLSNFKVSKKNALQVVKCLENLKPEDICESSIVHVQPAESNKEALKKHFEDLVVNAKELITAYKARVISLPILIKKLSLIIL